MTQYQRPYNDTIWNLQCMSIWVSARMFTSVSVKLLRQQKWNASLLYVVQRTYDWNVAFFSFWFACWLEDIATGGGVPRKHQFSICTKAARKINRLIVSANGIGSQNVAAFRCWETATWIVRVREMSDGRTVNAVANCFQLSRELSYPPRIRGI